MNNDKITTSRVGSATTCTVNGRTYWFDADHCVYAVIDTETGNPLPFRHERFPSLPRDHAARLHVDRGLKSRQDGDRRVELAAHQVKGIKISCSTSVDRLRLSVELGDEVVGEGRQVSDDRPPAGFVEVRHGSSSPLGEGAGTPCDPSVDEAAGPRPDSPQDADPEAGEQP